MTKHVRQRAFGLIEIMIALALSAGVLTVVAQVFISSKKNYQVQESLGRMQENARHALEIITQDLRMAGYLGEFALTGMMLPLTSPDATIQSPSNPFPGECYSTPYQWALPFVPDATGLLPPKITGQNSGANLYGCVANAKTQADTFSVHYVGPDPISLGPPIATFTAGTYLISNITRAMPFRCMVNNCSPGTANGWNAPAGSAEVSTTFIYPVRAATYFVDTSDRLRRIAINDVGTVQTTPETTTIAEGVVSMQLQYAKLTAPGQYRYFTADSSSLGNFTQSANWINWNEVIAVRVWLLMRTLDADTSYTNSGTKSVAEETVTLQTNYRHQLFVSTIALRN